MFAYTLFTSNPLPGAIDAIGQVRYMQRYSNQHHQIVAQITVSHLYSE